MQNSNPKLRGIEQPNDSLSNRSTSHTAHHSDRPPMDTIDTHVINASRKKTQSDLMQRLQPIRGPSSIKSRWKSDSDPLKPQPLRTNVSKKLEPIPHANNDLTSSLFSRLHTVEMLNKQMKSTIASKNNEILKLQAMVDSSSTSKSKEQVKVLEIKNSNLEKKVSAMEKWFLRHGMIWKDSEPHFDINGFVDAINRLNHVNEPSPFAFLAIYKNGYIIDESGFTLWTQQKGIQFLQDIMQGQSPVETALNYPNGVRFDVFDRHEMDFVESDFGIEEREYESLSNLASDSVQNSKNGNPKVIEKSQPLSKIGTLTYQPKESLESFMKRYIPKYIIRAGIVIQVREGLKDFINGTEGKLAVSNISTDFDIERSNISKLRIRVNDRQEYTITLNSKSKILELKRILSENDWALRDLSTWDLKLPLGLCSKYKISDNKTLYECNLVPSAKLFVSYH